MTHEHQNKFMGKYHIEETKDGKGSHQTMKNSNLFTNLHEVCYICSQFSLTENLFIKQLPLTKYV